MTTPTDQTRKYLMIAILTGVILIIIYVVGTPAWKGNCPEGYYPSRYLGKYTEPKIDAGVSYTDYNFWSLYGWRTNPPPGYPQETLVTPYNTTMNECQNWCNNTGNPGDCLRKCHFAALQSAGFHPTTDQLYNPTTIGELTPRPLAEKSLPYSIETYSPVNRSNPSHTSPSYRESQDGEFKELPPDREVNSGFCFYR